MEDIHSLLQERENATAADGMVLRRKISEWMLMQSIDESEEVELTLKEVEELARIAGVTIRKESSPRVQRTVRGYELWYDDEKVEIWLRERVYCIFFYPFKEYPGMIGPKVIIENIVLNKDFKEYLEVNCG